MDLQDLRREYLHGGLNKDQLNPDPIEQFQFWLDQAVKAELSDPTAMTVATVDADGQPSQRVVLLKQLDSKGFVFFTNYESKKARDIEINNKVSLHFAWLLLERQVKIQGIACKLSTVESLKYFSSRPRDSQLAAWSSKQSKTLSSRLVLETAFSQMKQKFKQGEIPLPGFWGGFRVEAEQFEFWQGRANRLHDRFSYTQNKECHWIINRLAP